VRAQFHTCILIGVQQVVVAINKMDTVEWSQVRFLEISNSMSLFLKNAGFKEADVKYIPVSGLTGINLTKPIDVPEASWYKGDTLIAEIGE